MKVRSGFVSNSSSSSFILLGIKLEDVNYQELCEKYLPKDIFKNAINKYKNDIDYVGIWYEHKDEIDTFDIITDDGPTYIGKELADSEYELDNGSVSLSEFEDMKEKLKEKFPDKECKLYFGTRMT